MSERRDRAACLALLAACWLLGLALLGVHDSVAYLAPVLGLAALLLSGYYPGERRLVAVLAGRRSRRRARPTRVAAVSARLPGPALASGGALIARALAGRAPPACSAAT